MDANGVRFQALLGRADWARCTLDDGRALADAWQAETSGAPASTALEWDDQRDELLLARRLFRFRAAVTSQSLGLDARRGAARDRHGNTYWIDTDRHTLRVQSAGTARTSTFWPPTAAPVGDSLEQGTFVSLDRPLPAEPVSVAGLVVTEDHYLVVATAGPVAFWIFDLYGGGPPTTRTWPADVSLEVFDLAPRRGGGFWMLDRANLRLWEIDRRWQVVAPSPAPSSPAVMPGLGPFQADPSSSSRDPVCRVTCVSTADATSLDLADPVAVEPLSDGSVLVLDRGLDEPFSRVQRYLLGIPSGPPVDFLGVLSLFDDADVAGFTLRAHDIAVTRTQAADGSIQQTLLVMGESGNQVFAFGLSAIAVSLTLTPLERYYPVRLFGGKALLAVDDKAWYDFGAGWVPLVAARRPRFEAQAILETPVFDSATPDCVWHRLVIDACLPQETSLEISSRAANDASELAATAWESEPSLVTRERGPELPWVSRAITRRTESRELLLQRARGRLLQIRIQLGGNGRATPWVRALRVYAPRFSYLEQYLPALYREDTPSASFLDRFLANVEGELTSWEDQIAQVQAIFDPRLAPSVGLNWLAGWLGIAFDPAWDEHRRRLFLRYAMEFFRWRGTIHGLQLALRLAFEAPCDGALFTDDPREARCTNRYRIVERFRSRFTPAGTAPVPAACRNARRGGSSRFWTPDLGAEDLHDRYRRSLATADPAVRYPIRRPETNAAAWEAFSKSNLGFAPSAGVDLRSDWQAFLEVLYVDDIDSLNRRHDSLWPDFDAVTLPSLLPAEGHLREDWEAFNVEARDATAADYLARWRSFLARRYLSVGALNVAHHTNWPSLDQVPYPVEIPTDPAQLNDWFQFEGVSLAMSAAAHRFTVLLPITASDLARPASWFRERLALADRIVNLEKPAHTVYDVQWHFDFFRVGSARLGEDTLLGPGSRAPELCTTVVLGQTCLSDGRLGTPLESPPADRYLPGTTALRRPSQGPKSTFHSE